MATLKAIWGRLAPWPKTALSLIKRSMCFIRSLIFNDAFYQLLRESENDKRKRLGVIHEELARTFSQSISPVFKLIKLTALILLSAYTFGRLLAISIFAIWLSSWLGIFIYQDLDDDPLVGAPEGTDYLIQGWKPKDKVHFYRSTQGSHLMQYDLFIALKASGSTDSVYSDAIVERYGFLSRKSSFFNNDALPIGFVQDTFQGNQYIGLGCAACHTSEIRYAGKAFRLDGGPANADLVGFMNFLSRSIGETLENSDKLQKFTHRVLSTSSQYSSAADVEEDLKRYHKQIKFYNFINGSHIDYGFGRLDILGRSNNVSSLILLDYDTVFDALAALKAPRDDKFLLSEEQINKLLHDVDLISPLNFSGLVRLYEHLNSNLHLYPGLTKRQLLRLKNALVNEPNAPVNYPPIWNIGHSTLNHYLGISPNTEKERNLMDARKLLGTHLSVNASLKPKTSVWKRITGHFTKQDLWLYNLELSSSLDLASIKSQRSRLARLRSPEWPEKYLGPINRDRAVRGKLIYAERCQHCHAVIDSKFWNRVSVNKIFPVNDIGTDPATASNYYMYQSASAILGKQVHDVDGKGVVFEARDASSKITDVLAYKTVKSEDPDKSLWSRVGEITKRTIGYYVIPAAKSLGLEPDKPIEYVEKGPQTMSYKAGPLNGIWATAPYLHNGSVPTLYDLLLPARRTSDSTSGDEIRPARFEVGSREFDPIKVGFRTEGYDGFIFDTSKRGNWNTGHEFGSGLMQVNGEVLPPLSEAQRWELIEYLKTL